MSAYGRTLSPRGTSRAPLVERTHGALIRSLQVGDIVEYVGPTVQRIFHIGFIPLVIILGMQTEPRPKLTDLFTPM